MVTDVLRLVGIQVIKLNLKAVRSWICFLEKIYSKIK
jgi:hypothetical protein